MIGRNHACLQIAPNYKSLAFILRADRTIEWHEAGRVTAIEDFQQAPSESHFVGAFF